MSRPDHESPNRLKLGHWLGILGLVAVEQAGLEHDRPASNTSDHNRPLQNLCQMVIDRVADHRPDHGVIGSERREPLTAGEREPCCAIDPAQQVVGREHELVQIGVGVTPIDESLAPCAWGQLAFRNGKAFEIDRGQKAEPVGEGTGVHHDRRMCQPHLCQ